MFIYNIEILDKNYNFEINSVSTVGDPQNNSIIFINKVNEKLLNNLKKIENSLIILKEGLNGELLKSNNKIIYSENPRLKYAEILTMILFSQNKNRELNFKDGYYYGENVNLGKNITIEPFVNIGNNVKIGNDVIIKSGAKIGNNVIVGKNSYIRENCVIGGEGFGIETYEDGSTIRIPHIGGVEIGENVEIGALTTVCSGTIKPTIIEDYVKVDDHVHIAHNNHIKNGSIITAGAILSGSVSVGKNTWIAPNATIINGCKIGDNVTIGLSARVQKEVKNKEIIANEAGSNFRDVVRFSKAKKKLMENLK